MTLRRNAVWVLLTLCVAAASAAAEGGRGHGGSHRFDDAEKWAKLFESPTRDAWQKPEAVLDRLGLADDMTAADIGSATGYFAVRLARSLPRGRVYGVDIEPDMVRFLNERAAEEGLDNLESVLGTADDPRLPEAVDLVLMVDTYHHIEERTAYFAKLAGKLAPGARVAIVDFKMGELPVGPPDAMKMPPERIVGELEAAGYELLREDSDTLPYQYLLIFARPVR